MTKSSFLRGGSFIGKGYAHKGLFKLNIYVVNNNNAYTFAKLFDFLDLSRVRLGHDDASIKRLKFLGNILKSNISHDSKCEHV